MAKKSKTARKTTRSVAKRASSKVAKKKPARTGQRTYRLSKLKARQVSKLRVTGTAPARKRRFGAALAQLRLAGRIRYFLEIPSRIYYSRRKTKDNKSTYLRPEIPATEVKLTAPQRQIQTRTALEGQRLRLLHRLDPLVKKVVSGKRLNKSERAEMHVLEAEVRRLVSSTPITESSMSRSTASPTDTDTNPSATDGTSNASDIAASSTESAPVLHQEVERRALELLGVQGADSISLRHSDYMVKDATYYDFASYEFLVNPYITRDLNCNPFPDLEELIRDAQEIFWEAVLTYFPRTSQVGDYQVLNVENRLQLFTLRMLELFIEHIAEDLYDFYLKLLPPYSGYSGNKYEDIKAALAEFARDVAMRGYDPGDINSSFDSPQLWEAGYVAIYDIFTDTHPGANVTNDVLDKPQELPFTPFPHTQVNFGLRVVYRQEWEKIGTQPGEIVRTIPLGPKQTEKVTAKVVTRRKLTNKIETLSATEAIRESSQATKDTDDVVTEASESFNVHTEASASGGIAGVFSASASMGSAYDTASSSKNAKSRLNESMAKSSSKMRSETKVIVSTEQEDTSEFTTTSEITNPNEEIAVTYVYSKLQRQYQVTTDLAEISSVVLVPHCMPTVADINEQWIQDHAWILAKVLLDDSFRDDLVLIANEPTTAAPANPDDTNNKFGLAMDEAVTGIGSYSGFTGNLPDVFRVAQENYSSRLQRYENYQREVDLRTNAVAKLQKHIVANVLHYMRAIWHHEDREQRLQRLGQVMVPGQWEFISDTAPTDSALTNAWDGAFFPVLGEDNLLRLTDVIDPTGPIDYVGNYAVYELRSTVDSVHLHKALSAVRAKYAYFSVQVTNESSLSVNVVQAVAIEPRFQSVVYRIYRWNNDSWIVWNSETNVENQIPVHPDKPVIEYEGILLQLDALTANNEDIWVEVAATMEVEDPELKFLRATVALPSSATEANAVFTANVIDDMKAWLTDITDLLPVDPTIGWNNFLASEQSLLLSNYHRYLSIRDNSRRILIDSNNLLLDLEVGDTPALEHYKRLSRLVDVLKELEEYVIQRVDRDRRLARLAGGNLDDPEIDSFHLVAGSKEVEGLITSLGD